MANLLKTGLAWLGGQRRASMATAVTYRREGMEVAVEDATIGRTLYEEDQGTGVLQRVESRDFLIGAGQLEPLFPPVSGDEIVEDESGDVYMVASPGGAPPWRYTDGFQNTLRIHTKAVGVPA